MSRYLKQFNLFGMLQGTLYYLLVLTTILLLSGYGNSKPTILDEGKTKYIILQVLKGNIEPANPNYVNQALRFTLVYRFTAIKPFHINSGSPLIEGLIPTTTTLTSPTGTIIKQSTIYPPDEILDISGFRTTIFEGGPHEITETYLYSPSQNQSKNNIDFSYSFNYQACKDDECYAPESIKGDFTLAITNNNISNFLERWISLDFIAMILFAFIGGLILNFTPCVLPILSLKLLSLSAMKDTESHLKKKYVTYYTFGVLSFFLLLAGTLSVLKLTGESIGWGIQFQNPYYVFFIILVLLLVALNFFGVYELRFSYHKNPHTGNNASTEQWKNFGTGFLSVILATPCTVPFLGLAVAYAFSQSIAEIILLHVFIALGFLLPYLLIFVNLDVSRLLPNLRPLQGYVKKVSGFVLLITIFWLLDIYQNLNTIDSSFYIFTSLWAISLLVWIFGQLQKRPLPIKVELMFWLVLILFLGWLNISLTANLQTGSYKPLSSTQSSNPISTSETIANKVTDTGVIDWIPYSKESLNAFKQSGRIVYVHFTADWCLNCKVNEKLVIENEAVVKLLQELEVITVKADWTKPNPDIFEEIQALGRAGIPLDVLYRGGEKIILSSILTVSEIVTELEKIAK